MTSARTLLRHPAHDPRTQVRLAPALTPFRPPSSRANPRARSLCGLFILLNSSRERLRTTLYFFRLAGRPCVGQARAQVWGDWARGLTRIRGVPPAFPCGSCANASTVVHGRLARAADFLGPDRYYDKVTL